MKEIITLLNNNKEFYSDAEAAALRSAIATWNAAHKKNDVSGMEDAQTDVQTQYDILSGIIKDRKDAVTPTPDPTDTSSTTEPTPTPTEAPVPSVEPSAT